MSISTSLHEIAQRLGGEVTGHQVLCPGPEHSPGDRSLAVKLAAGAPDGFLVYSHAGDDGIECKKYVMQRLTLPTWEPPVKAARAIKSSAAPIQRKVIDRFIYLDEAERPFLRVSKTDPKSFFQHAWNGREWVAGAPARKIPYRLPELLQAEHDTVVIVEGEKDADNVAKLGFVATTNAGGAGKWTSELNPFFRHREVFILPDNDMTGMEHAKQVNAALTPVAKSVRIVRLPPTFKDVSKWIEAGGTANTLAIMMEATLRLFPEENHQ